MDQEDSMENAYINRDYQTNTLGLVNIEDIQVGFYNYLGMSNYIKELTKPPQLKKELVA
jgi:hypothetical protein